MASRRRRRRPLTEAAFDLVAIRKLKRLATRVVRGLEEWERYLVKMEKLERQQRASAEGIEAARELYQAAARFVDEGSEDGSD